MAPPKTPRRGGPARHGHGTAPAEDGPADEDAWMLTYTDMVTLMLTMFVVLVALSSFETPEDAPGQEAVVLDGGRPLIVFRGEPIPLRPLADQPDDPERPLALEEPPAPARPELAERPPAPDRELERLRALRRLSGAISETLREHLAETEDIDVKVVNQRVVIEMRETILFPSAQAALTPSGAKVLAVLEPALASVDARIDVEGHTDTLPIATDRFPSNWELSTARATAVARALIAEGLPPGRLRAIGYADTAPRATNATAEGRALNRRVRLVLVPGTGGAAPGAEGEDRP